MLELMPRLRPRLSALALILALSSLSACKENGNDYLTEGLRLLGEAERGDCRPEVEGGQAMINGAKVAQCLDKTKTALEALHKARELGVETRELENLIQDTETEVATLESMLKIVSRFEHEQ